MHVLHVHAETYIFRENHQFFFICSLLKSVFRTEKCHFGKVTHTSVVGSLDFFQFISYNANITKTQKHHFHTFCQWTSLCSASSDSDLSDRPPCKCTTWALSQELLLEGRRREAEH